MPPVNRDILVCVAGATPQIITETIYALAQKNPPVYINELFIITTKKGRKIITETLIKKGILNSLIKEYELPELKFSEDSIITIKVDGEEIDDIRNSKESEAAADIIAHFISELTKDPKTRIHCSIAGGRKTMSFYLGTALQLFGRPQDKLYHVLVSPEFEANPDFFYPPKKPRKINCKLENGSLKKVSTAQAKIDLAELPFLRLREKIESNNSTFSELIKNSQSEIDNAIIQPKILVKLREREIKIASKTLTLSPVLLAIYAFFLKRKLVCSISNNCALCNDCYVNINDLTERPLIDELALLYGMIYDNDPVKIEKFKENYSSKYSTENIRSYISKINHKISLTLEDNPMSQYFLIKTIRKYGSSLYGIVVDRRKIRIL